MQMYYYQEGENRKGPFTAQELLQYITPLTLICREGETSWIPAAETDDFKALFQVNPAADTGTAPLAEQPVAVAAQTETVVETAVAEKENIPVSPAIKKETVVVPGRKKTAWLSWVVALLAFGGAGYFVYQDMQKQKGGSRPSVTTTANDSATLRQHIEKNSPADNDVTVATNPDSSEVPRPKQEGEQNAMPVPAADAVKAEKNKSDNLVVTKPTVTPVKDKKAEAQAASAAQKKIQQDKAKAEAAAAAALAAEKNYRNNWAKYITIGKMDIAVNDDGIAPFNVPVYNGTNATLDKVEVRIDYWKKDKKVVHSENIIVYNVPPGAGLNGKAAGYKKGSSAKAVITAITCRKLHFCYPGSSYTPDDPFYCQ